ncbi:MAG: hypothetical protein QGI31_07320 [Dehalococcoidia bacterium]|nr:hypothetical protein [Dehalococcoidia bacterium]
MITATVDRSDGTVRLSWRGAQPTGRQPLYATHAVTILWDKARKGQPVFS